MHRVLPHLCLPSLGLPLLRLYRSLTGAELLFVYMLLFCTPRRFRPIQFKHAFSELLLLRRICQDTRSTTLSAAVAEEAVLSAAVVEEAMLSAAVFEEAVLSVAVVEEAVLSADVVQALCCPWRSWCV